jgi:cell division protein FtsB
MDIDPNVQVALVSVIATVITTAGVVAVAIINNRRERGNAASEGVEAALDERDVLERMLALISENERKEATITGLRKANGQLRAENSELREENSNLRSENNSLRNNTPREGRRK